MNENKKSIEEKGVQKETPVVEDQDHSQWHRNLIAVPKAIIDELKSKNLEYRWLNYNEYSRNGYIHKNRWQAYKPDTGTSTKKFSNDVNGYIKRGDLVLGVRSIALGDQHRKFMEERRLRHMRYNKTKAEELKRQLSNDGVDTVVDDKWETKGRG